MDLFYRLFALSFLAQYCAAGPLVAVIAEAAASIAEIAVDAEAAEAVTAGILGGRLGAAVGVGVSEVWFDQFVVVNGALYYGSAAAGAGVLAGGAAAGAGAYVAVTQAAASKSIMSEKHSASMASASMLVASMEKIVSEVNSKKRVSSVLQVSSAAARASVVSQMLGPVVHDTAKDPFTFTFSTSKKSKRAPNGPATTAAAAAATAASPPPGTPVSSLPPDKRPTEVPAGIPEYNWRMCQNDIIRMGQNKQNLLFDQPAGQAQSMSVADIPSTCMDLSNYLVGNPALGPHPVVMGADKLQWNNIDIDTIHLIRQSFGAEPKNATLFASVFGKK